MNQHIKYLFIILFSVSICRGELRKDTEVEIIIGPLVDAVDGKTPITTMDINDVNCFVFKNAMQTVKTVSGSNLTHSAAGYWILTLTTADTNTAGNIKIVLQDDDVFLPYCEERQIFQQDVWDALYGTDTLMVHIELILSKIETLITRIGRTLEYTY